MSSGGKIAELAAIVSLHSSKIDTYISEKGLPQPSFDVHAPLELALPPELQQSRNAVFNAMEELHANLAGPLPYLARVFGPTVNILMSAQAICRYKIATSFALDERITFREIASRCGLQESDTRRLLRNAIAYRIFQEPENGVAAHSALSKLLAHAPPIHQFVSMVCEEMWLSGAHTVDAMQRWDGSEEPTQTGFAIANGTEASFYDIVGKEPERAKRFADAMEFLQAGPQLKVNHLLDNLDWDTDSCPKLVVDVGGSQGKTSIEILQRFPDVRCIVQDLEEVLVGSEVPSDLQERLSFQTHNMFTEQNVEDADVYLLRGILHNWSDKYAVQIIRNLLAVLKKKKDSKLILNETCLPEPGILSNYEDQFLRGWDLAMKQNMNGKEREANEWIELIKAVDPGLKIMKITTPPGSLLSIIEVKWVGTDI
jgi:hypothetical protein